MSVVQHVTRDDLNHKIEAALSAKADWKNAISQIIESSSNETLYPCPEESINFFIKNSIPNSMAENGKSQKINNDVDGKQENHDAQIEDEIATKSSSNDDDVYQMEQPVLRSRKDRKQREEEFLIHTDDKIIGQSIVYGEKTDENLEEDKIHLESIAKHLPIKNIQRLNERLYRDSGSKWFSGYVYYVYEFLMKYFTWWKVFFEKPTTHLSDSNLYNYQPIMSREKFSLFETQKQHIRYKILIQINALLFEDHPLMSEENRVASQLMIAFKKYQNLSADQKKFDWLEKIETIQSNINNIQADESQLDENQARIRQNRLKVLKKQLRRAFEYQRKVAQDWRNVLLSLLDLWEELKQKRRTQSYSSTTVRLKYSEMEDQDREEREKNLWNKIVNDRFAFEKMIRKEEFEEELEEYRKQMRAWRNRRKLKTDRKNSEEMDQSSINPTSDGNSIESSIIMKPKPPKSSVNDGELLQSIKDEIFLPDGRLPGEPKLIDFELDFNHPITATPECPAFERKRRTDVKNIKYALEIQANDSVSVKTKETDLNLDFKISWPQKLTLDLRSEINHLRINLIEKISPTLKKIQTRSSSISSRVISLPTAIIDSSNTESLNEQIERTVNLSNDTENQTIRANCDYFAAWIVDEVKNIQSPSTDFLDSNSLTKDDLDAMRKEIEYDLDKLDQNETESIELLKTLASNKSLNTLSKPSEKALRTLKSDLKLIERELRFCDQESLVNNLRFEMIRLRTRGDSQIEGTSIPLLEREVPKSLFLDRSGPERVPIRSLKGLEAKRAKAMSILGKVQRKVRNLAENMTERPRAWEDMVLEEEFRLEKLRFFMAFNPLKGQFERHRMGKKRFTPYSHQRNIKLVVRIASGFNIPIRIDDDPSISNKVNSIIEVIFQKQCHKTNSSAGAQPSWDETLAFEVNIPNNDFSPSNLATIDDSIYINLYDQLPEAENESKKLLNIRFLGSISIPFSTLYLNSKIGGRFKLNMHPNLIGYRYDGGFGHLTQQIPTEVQSSLNAYLTVFLSIEPDLPRPKHPIIKCESMESSQTLSQTKHWEIQLRGEFSHRSIRALAVDLNAQHVTITRYLSPIKPPDSLIQNLTYIDEAAFRLARFISLIPSIPDSIAITGAGDVWSNASQFLDMLIGDEEEHAILLCNFLLYLGKRAGVVLGLGIPEGSTAYVIVWEFTGQEPSIWNPMTGEKFNIRDSYIPLHAIGTIFTSENVYANAQKQEHPNRLNYDLTKTSDWRPLFNRKFPNPRLPTVQPETINFESPDPEYVRQLQIELERNLSECLIEWREKSQTFFNRAVTQQIRKILPKLEMRVSRFQSADVGQELKTISSAYKVIGYPFHSQFSTTKAIIDKLFSTGIHLVNDEKASFAIAVYIHPYPCYVLSVWVYAVALLRDA
ncbi:coiled-coil and C2 domain containing 2A [Brevipalpus obovatus]|uniref:coiled-coil and C2 domain containing 2A n=1 Tax=Brevipalpus obovatus TaxID=246614 RepID=UPI003D9E1885